MGDSQGAPETTDAALGSELELRASSSAAILESLRDFFVEDAWPGELPGEHRSS